jgi:hypothetical protein
MRSMRYSERSACAGRTDDGCGIGRSYIPLSNDIGAGARAKKTNASLVRGQKILHESPLAVGARSPQYAATRVRGSIRYNLAFCDPPTSALGQKQTCCAQGMALPKSGH